MISEHVLGLGTVVIGRKLQFANLVVRSIRLPARRVAKALVSTIEEIENREN